MSTTHPSARPSTPTRQPTGVEEGGVAERTGRQSVRPRTNPACPARAHGTISAARKSRGGRCVCPEALEAMRLDRVTEQARRRQRYAEKRQEAEQVVEDGSVTAPPFASPDTPEIGTLGAAGQRVLFGTDAACAGCDPELWFAVDPAATARAKRICYSCPLADSCLTHALRHEIYGTWGGLSEDERQAVRERRWAWGLASAVREHVPDRIA